MQENSQQAQVIDLKAFRKYADEENARKAAILEAEQIAQAQGSEKNVVVPQITEEEKQAKEQMQVILDSIIDMLYGSSQEVFGGNYKSFNELSPTKQRSLVETQLLHASGKKISRDTHSDGDINRVVDKIIEKINKKYVEAAKQAKQEEEDKIAKIDAILEKKANKDSFTELMNFFAGLKVNYANINSDLISTIDANMRTLRKSAKPEAPYPTNINALENKLINFFAISDIPKTVPYEQVEYVQKIIRSRSDSLAKYLKS